MKLKIVALGLMATLASLHADGRYMSINAGQTDIDLLGGSSAEEYGFSIGASGILGENIFVGVETKVGVSKLLEQSSISYVPRLKLGYAFSPEWISHATLGYSYRSFENDYIGAGVEYGAGVIYKPLESFFFDLEYTMGDREYLSEYSPTTLEYSASTINLSIGFYF